MEFVPGNRAEEVVEKRLRNTTDGSSLQRGLQAEQTTGKATIPRDSY